MRSTQLSDTDIVNYLTIGRNMVSQRLGRFKYIPLNWDIFTTDIVADQNEYSLSDADETSEVENVEISDVRRVLVEWVEVKRGAPWQTDCWFYGNGSIFLNPTPWATVTDWLVIEWLYTNEDLDAEDQYLFPKSPFMRTYSHVVCYKAIELALQTRYDSSDSDTNTQYQKFEQAYMEMENDLIISFAPTYSY